MAQIVIPEANIRQFCIHNQIKRLALFGSVLSDNFRSDSDIDVIMEFISEKRAGMLTMARIERELSQIFEGRKINLRTPAELSHYFREDILLNAEVCYDN